MIRWDDFNASRGQVVHESDRARWSRILGPDGYFLPYRQPPPLGFDLRRRPEKNAGDAPSAPAAPGEGLTEGGDRR